MNRRGKRPTPSVEAKEVLALFDQVDANAPTSAPVVVDTRHEAAAAISAGPPAGDRRGAGELRYFVGPGQCGWCGSTRRWVSIHRVEICGNCHPPAGAGLVAKWIEKAGTSAREEETCD